MSVPKRSTIRVPGFNDPNGYQNGVVVEIPSPRRSNTFSISYADQRPGSSRVSSSGTAPQRSFLDSSEGEGDIPTSEEGESEHEGEDRARMAASPTSMTTTTTTTNKARPAADPFQDTPHLSRTMSMPLPLQLSHLQHPHRQQTRTIYSHPITPTHPASPFNSLSVELADSFQMVIQTMLQISPPQVLESAKEQYSACSLSIPTPSMSAMFTAMKTLNYMSANLLRFYSSESGSLGYSDGEVKVQNVFDIGELLQCVGDTLSGVVAQAGVDLVLHYGEVGVRHVYVKGDECGIAYALLHIVRQILDKAHPGDLIELGLAVTPHGVQTVTPSIPDEVVEGRVTASPIDLESLRCSIKIEHKYGPSVSSEANEDHVETADERQRTNPQFPSLLLRRLLRLIDAQFTIQNNVEDGQIYEVSLLLNKAASPASKALGPLSGSVGVLEEASGLDTDPSVEQLLAFGETLKGRKVSIYANSANAFTRHITSYLVAWGMDVHHVFLNDRNERSISEGTPTPVQESRFSGPTTIPAVPLPEATVSSSINVPRPVGPENQAEMSFVLIDDDVGILRERLQALRAEKQPLNLNTRARPSLAALHRPKSSPQMARVLGQSAPTRPSPVVFLHFTSLANFKATKDVIQSVMSTYGSAVPLPEVMIIPKPVGPRRFLTAMHTAVTRPMIDPFFLPTATSPGTPGVQLSGSFFPPASDPEPNNQTPQTGSPFSRPSRPHGSRSSSDRSAKEHLFTSLPSPSPLGIPDNVEYFPDPAGKLGLSPSSGYLVSSPDGQPAGIFFHPRSKKNASPQSTERVGNHTTTIQRRSSIPRLFSGGEKDAMSFAALHEVSSQPSGSATEPKPSATTESPKSNTPTPAVPITPVTRDGASTPGPRSPPESPGNENGPSKKAAGKQPLQEKQETIGKGVGVAAGKKSKTSSPSDGNIVPPISVLIVDDNPINQTILSTFMKRKKIRYGIANNGKEAVEKWKTGGFHLILMDIQMPIMDGIEATREIRRLEKLNGHPEFEPAAPSQMAMDVSAPSSTSTSETRSANGSSPYRSSVIIVALTASSLQSDRVNALAAGCNDFLTKPVSLLWLNNKIIEWGSIKALQMWADIRPEAVRKMSKGQAAQARVVAERLYMPKNRKSPPRRTSFTEKTVPPPSEPLNTAAIEVLTRFMGQDVADEASVNSIDSGVEGIIPAPSTTPPKRRRSQKRDSAPESLKLKAEELAEAEAHGTPRASSPFTNGGPPTPAEQKQDDVYSMDPKLEKTETRQDPGLSQEPQPEDGGARIIAPLPQSPILRPR